MVNGKRILSNKKKKEFSKIMCILASVAFCFLGCWIIWKYYALTELAIQMGSGTTPDATLPIAGITSILVPFVSYLMYQFKLKNSRNKYGISELGVPYTLPDNQGVNE